MELKKILEELRVALEEVNRLKHAILHHKWEMREYRGAFYDEELWEAVGELPKIGGE